MTVLVELEIVIVFMANARSNSAETANAFKNNMLKDDQEFDWLEVRSVNGKSAKCTIKQGHDGWQ